MNVLNLFDDGVTWNLLVQNFSLYGSTEHYMEWVAAFQCRTFYKNRVIAYKQTAFFPPLRRNPNEKYSITTVLTRNIEILDSKGDTATPLFIVHFKRLFFYFNLQ